MRKPKSTLVLASLLSVGAALGQQTSGVFLLHQPSPFTPLVYDQDWSYLSDSHNIQDFSDHLHFVEIGHDAKKYVSFGAQMRERGEYFDHPAWGAQPPYSGYLLERYLFSADLHLHDSLRLFCQPGSSIVNGRDGGPRTAIDEQTLSLNQCFFDVRLFHREKRSLVLRAGRQLISLGSTRLVAIGAGLNVEQPFDGLRLAWDTGAWQFQGMAVRPVAIDTGIFASAPDHTQELWGVYGTHAISFPKAKLDVYYLGYRHAKGVWAQGVGREQRETIGARVHARSSTWYYDWEYTYQLGRFGSRNILAWSLGTNTGYTFPAMRFTPRVELDAGAISGDGNLHDKTLGSFNSLFPNGSYLGQAVLIGPFNLIVARPKLELHLTRKVTFSPNLEFLWRESTTDAIYGAVGYPTHSGTASSARFVGAQSDAEVAWNVSRHTILSVDYVHFFPGEYLKQTPPGRPVNFVAPELTYNF